MLGASSRVHTIFSQLAEDIKFFIIPLEEIIDKPIWIPSNLGNMTFKGVFSFFQTNLQSLSWHKILRKKGISPSKSFLFWRWIHDCSSTDDNLNVGFFFSFASICSHCGASVDNAKQLFQECPLAMKLWNQLSHLLQCSKSFSSAMNLFHTCCNSISSQVKDVHVSLVVHIIQLIWYSRNQARCESGPFQYEHIVHKVISKGMD